MSNIFHKKEHAAHGMKIATALLNNYYHEKSNEFMPVLPLDGNRE